MDARQAARESGICGQHSIGPPKRRESVLDRYDSEIRELLIRYPDIKVVEVHRRLRQIGYSSSYTILRLRVKEIRQSIASGKLAEVIAPGAVGIVSCSRIEQLSVSNRMCNAYLFRFHLVYSSTCYLHLETSDEIAVVLYLHLRAFKQFKGAPAMLQYNNIPAVGNPGDNQDASFNPLFLRFANHYGFYPRILSRIDDQWEIEVDRLAKQFLSGQQFRCIDHANEALSQWTAQNSTAGCAPEDAESEKMLHEQQHLIPLPNRPWNG